MKTRIETILETVSGILDESRKERRLETKGKKRQAAYAHVREREKMKRQGKDPGPKKYFGSDVERGSEWMKLTPKERGKIYDAAQERAYKLATPAEKERWTRGT